MAQKWNNGSENVFEYSLNSESASQMHNISNNSHSSTVDNHILGSQQIMIPSGNSYIESSNSSKESCLTNSDCNRIQTNCTLNSDSLIMEQPTDRKANQDDGTHNQNLVTCFVCCCPLPDVKNLIPIKDSTNYSHAPLIVLLMDVLGYKLDGSNLHAQAVCKSCFHLLDTIDELQQTLTESKTDLRTKFLETIHRLKLKYPRTDKMLKPRCLRCVQMGQVNSRKKLKGNRLPKGKKSEEVQVLKKGKKKGNNQSEETCSGEEECSAQEESNEVKEDIKQTETDAYPNSETSENSIRMLKGSSNIVYDTDPVFFSPDEKLKAGFVKENDGTKVFLCIYCTARYDDTLSLKMHVRVYHMPIIIYDNGQSTNEAQYRMGIKLQNLSTNEFSVTEKPYSCLFCISSYKLQGSLQFHFRENHSPHKPFQCLECNECFRRTIELSRHREYRCPLRKPATVQPKR